MNSKLITAKFKDLPEPEELNDIIEKWQRPEYGREAEEKGFRNPPGIPPFPKGEINPRRFSRRAEHPEGTRYPNRCGESWYSSERLPDIQDGKFIVDWLYDFIRLNVKRGRIFDLREVLKTGRADCLGYCKVFTVLGRSYGLNTGVVDVIIDNRGRHVPHTVILVKLPDNKFQFIDFWYGSKDIRHKRFGLRIRHGDKWRVEDIDDSDLIKAESFSFLPDSCVNGITLYIEGNRSLKKHDYPQAIQQYSRSIRFYPLNSRTFYNRAIAYENLGELKKAKAGYARALKDNAATLRTLATQPSDSVDLIQMDEKKIPEAAQQIYLLSKGFITGRPVAPAEIAQRMDLTLPEVAQILASVEDSLAIKME